MTDLKLALCLNQLRKWENIENHWKYNIGIINVDTANTLDTPNMTPVLVNVVMSHMTHVI